MNKHIFLYPLFSVCVLSALLCVYFMSNVHQLTQRFKGAGTHGVALITHGIQMETTQSKYHGNHSMKRADISQIKTSDRTKRKQLSRSSNSQKTLNKPMKLSNQTKSTYKMDDLEKNGNHLLKKDGIFQIETAAEKKRKKLSNQTKSTYKMDDLEKNGNHLLKKDGIFQIETVAEKKRTHFLGLTGAWGRLGNHMFFYASLRGIGDAINYTPILSRADPILKLFEINLNNSIDKLTLNNNVVKREKCIGIFTRDLVSPIDKTTNITVSGYLQSFKYFQKIESDIREEFILKADIKARVNHIFNTLNITHRIKVGVHVRRGDFVHRGGTKVPNPSYYYKAMNILRRNLTNPIFVVCSEDKKWVTDYLQFNDSVIVHESVEVDFGVLMSCDHSIISSGTFGWWTAYLTKGTSIYFKGFPSPPLLGCIIHPDYYPPHWIGLE